MTQILKNTRIFITYVRLLARNLFKLFLRFSLARVRNPTVTKKEYEEFAWASVLSSKEWERFESIDDFVTKRNDLRRRVCLVDGKVDYLTTHAYYTYRKKTLRYLVEPYLKEGTGIVELGCGWGFNLFSLADSIQKPTTMLGMDVSHNGLQAGRQVSEKFGVPVDFKHIDLLDDTHPNWKEIKSRVVMTYYCLEQLANYMDRVISNLIKAGPELVIHIEPTRELSNPLNLLDFNSLVYSRARDYPGNIVSTILNKQDLGLVKVEKVQKKRYAPSLQNYPVFIVWKPV
jgi:hypothetical protein